MLQPSFRALAACLCAAHTAAQVQTLTAPAVAATRDGVGILEAPGFMRSMRQQVVLGPTHLVAAQGQDLVALRFRRDGYEVEHTAGATQLVVRLSASPSLDPRRPDARFDANHKNAPVTVFQGTLQLPRSPTLPHRHAATWAMPDAVTIPFVTPFRYVGGALCVDIEGLPVAGSTSSWWSVDAEQSSSGSVTAIGQGCGSIAQRVSRVASADARTLHPGSTARFLAFGDPGSLGIMFLGGEQLGPIDLGFLGAPGCNLYLMPVASMSSVVGAGLGQRPGAANIAFALPAESAFLGAALFVQWANLDVQSTLTTSNALRCQLAASASNLDAATITGLMTPAGLPAFGRIDVGIMPVVQIDYRAP